MNHSIELNKAKQCAGNYVLAINDTMNVVSGKWKLPIIGALLFGKKRFKELERNIPKRVGKEHPEDHSTHVVQGIEGSGGKRYCDQNGLRQCTCYRRI